MSDTRLPSQASERDAEGGTCRQCGQDLVHIFGGRTYHPWTEKRACAALLPIPGTELVGSDVPFDQFIPAHQKETGR